MMKIFFILFFTTTLVNCTGIKPVTSPPVVKPLPDKALGSPTGKELNGAWELEKLWGSENKWGTSPSMDINLANQTFTGFTGCNVMRGKFSIKDNFIAINREIITSKMACPNYNDNAFLEILLKINRYMVNDSTLELSQDDIVLMRFTKNESLKQ